MTNVLQLRLCEMISSRETLHVAFFLYDGQFFISTNTLLTRGMPMVKMAEKKTLSIQSRCSFIFFDKNQLVCRMKTLFQVFAKLFRSNNFSDNEMLFFLSKLGENPVRKKFTISSAIFPLWTIFLKIRIGFVQNPFFQKIFRIQKLRCCKVSFIPGPIFSLKRYVWLNYTYFAEVESNLLHRREITTLSWFPAWELGTAGNITATI